MPPLISNILQQSTSRHSMLTSSASCFHLLMLLLTHVKPILQYTLECMQIPSQQTHIALQHTSASHEMMTSSTDFTAEEPSIPWVNIGPSNARFIYTMMKLLRHVSTPASPNTAGRGYNLHVCLCGSGSVWSCET